MGPVQELGWNGRAEKVGIFSTANHARQEATLEEGVRREETEWGVAKTCVCV